MEYGTNDMENLERLETLFSHPETISSEELEVWMQDKEFKSLYATAMHTRRVLLERHSQPDAKREFRAFRRWRMKQPTQVPADKHNKPFQARIWISAAIAACLLALVAFHIGKQWHQTSDSIQVYYAQSESGHVTLTMGDDTVSLSGQTTDALPLLPGMNINKENGLEYKEVAKDLPQTEIQHSLSTSTGKNFQLTLPDGTRVWLNAESKLSYPRSFTGNTRTVQLQGEAYFEVAKDKEHPFIVQSGPVQTTVLGTSFNIRNYAGTPIHVTLVKGLVDVTHKGQRLTLQPGQAATMTDDNRLTAENVDIKAFTCWKDGYFYFDNMSLCDIMVQIGKWYNLDVIFTHSYYLNDLLHFHAEKEWCVNEFIQQINLICETKVYLKNNKLIVE